MKNGDWAGGMEKGPSTHVREEMFDFTAVSDQE